VLASPAVRRGHDVAACHAEGTGLFVGILEDSQHPVAEGLRLVAGLERSALDDRRGMIAECGVTNSCAEEDMKARRSAWSSTANP